VTENEAMGPISYLVVEFPGNKMTGEGFPILVDLVDKGVVRILDLRFITRDLDGSVRALELADINRDGRFDLAVFDGVSSGLVDQSDFDDVASVIKPGSSAGILIFENRWATSFVNALRRGEAELVAAGYIPYDSLVSSLDATEPAGAWGKEDKIMPGLLRGAARVAVVAGTATAVSNRVSRRQANRWAAQDEQAYNQQQQYAQPQYAQPQYAQPQYAQPAPDPIEQLQKLADLKAQGILTEAEFQAQKAKVLA
jgi:Family of unknown function (DUF6325)/Short C-terminal domain